MAEPAVQGTEGSGGRTTKESIQDVIISVVIAFALAFVFRGFVVEAFVIPTGSMAPTLFGAHERFRNEKTGNTWQVGPWDANPPNSSNYISVQGTQRGLKVHDPMSGQVVEKGRMPLLSGDRILVLKYLYTIFEPQRFDVTVFKYKDVMRPEVNYIKRLTGLPGEEIALVDGDVFFRKHMDKSHVQPEAAGGANRWDEAGWQVARKPVHVQAAMWQKVFNSDYAPRNPTTSGTVTTTPWRSSESGWTIGGRVYEYTGAAGTTLFWDNDLLRFNDMGSEAWGIDDRYAYDETPRLLDGRSYPVPEPRFPVADLRMSAGLEPGSAGLEARATILARGHEFQMEVSEAGIVLRMRPEGAGGGAWQEVARSEEHVLRTGAVTNVAFCNIDQTLEAWVEGKRVLSHAYEWSPAERIAFATGKQASQLLAEEDRSLRNAFTRTQVYRKARVSWSFEGAPVKMHRVSLDRDIYYQPGMEGRPARASRPEAPMVLNDDQFFVCGDNSPQSLDARLWDPPEPFVREIDPTEGVVPRKMMLGKAFFVYFPALHEEARLPVPDFGRMRFIW